MVTFHLLICNWECSRTCTGFIIADANCYTLLQAVLCQQRCKSSHFWSMVLNTVLGLLHTVVFSCAPLRCAFFRSAAGERRSRRTQLL
ncbi:hypothetical protein XELAEV_18008135mg [Xenopus laevis]|uniref:Uncharacterized protein n=1 Tax=Xenopus laevis TaxID=8355 RepID=A0A974E3L4_XENLA|nr:hypothetical protein XELAEV_18008135mg [Xenopus laevis]